MGKQRRGRSERDSLPYLTVGRIEQLARLHLNERDIAMLKIINRFRYMTSYQLYKLTPPTEGSKPFTELKTGMRTCNRRLRVLFDNYFINKESPQLGQGEGTSVQYVWLDKGGNYIVNEKIEKGKKTLPNDHMHYSSIVDFYIYVKECVCGNDSTSIYTIRYYDNERKLDTINLIPDTVLGLSNNGKPEFYIIEIDRCFKKENLEIEKIKAYSDWKHGYAWKGEPWAKLVSDPVFPKILYLVDDTARYWKGRVKRISKAISAYDLDIDFIPLSKMYNGENIFKL